MRCSFRFLLSCLVLCLLSNSVFALEGNNGWSSFLDYGYGADKGNYLNFTSNGMFNYQLPFTASVRSVQGLIQGSGKTLTSVSFGRSGSTSTYPCTLIPLGNSLYKFYLTRTDLTMNSDEFQLYFTNDGSGHTVVRLLEFEFSEARSLLYAEPGWLDLYWNNGSTQVNNTASMVNTSSPVIQYFGRDVGQDFNSLGFNCYFSFSDWKNYDYMQFHVRVMADFVNSVSASIGNKPLPFEISYINCASGTDMYGDILAESSYTQGSSSTEGSFYFTDNNRNYLDITVTVDIRNCDLHTDEFPKIDIRGMQTTEDNQNYVQLVYACGIVEYEPVSPLYSFLRLFVNGFSDSNELLAHIYDQNVIDHEAILGWFSEINLSITNFGSSIVDRLDKLLERDDTSGSDDFQDDLASQATEMENIDEILDSVTKPSLDDIDTSVDDIVSNDDVSRYTGFLRAILSNSIISSLCLMSLTFAFISFVIFGKR